MEVIGLVSWFDESPAWLAATVASLSKVCGSVVAFDGSYGLFPDTRAKSSPEQAEVVLGVAEGLGMAATVHRPREKWWEGEVAKRSAMFDVGMAFATESEDWFLILDADEVIVEAGPGTRTQLAETDLSVAEFTFTDAWGGRSPLRRFFRALPGLRCEGSHYTIAAEPGDGRKLYLSGDPDLFEIESALSLPDVRVLDRSPERDPDRRAAKAAYYERAIPLEQAALRRPLPEMGHPETRGGRP